MQCDCGVLPFEGFGTFIWLLESFLVGIQAAACISWLKFLCG